MKRILLILSCLTILTACDDNISVKPDEFPSKKNSQPLASQVNTVISINYNDIESKVNELFTKPIINSGKGEFKEKYQAKSDNPGYDPNRWLYANNPLYSPNRMIEVCVRIFGFKDCYKTNNPLYDPRKRIKTKNLLFDPNRYIYADVATIQIGYNYNYSVKRSGAISFNAISENTIRIAVPMSIDANIGFEGDLAKIGLVEKKNIKADVSVELDVNINFQNDWCPIIKSKVDLNWSSGPKFEIAGGIWLDFNFLANLTNPIFEKQLKDSLATIIDCDAFKKQVNNFVKPSSVALQDKLDGTYVNILPETIYAPVVSFDNEKIYINLATKIKIDVSNEPVKISDFKLPPLTPQPGDFYNKIIVSVPLKLKYSFIEDQLNANTPALNIAINKQIKMTSNSLIKLVDKVTLSDFDIYPSGDNIAVGIKLDFKSTNSLLSTEGNVYLSSQIAISENNVVTLKNAKLTTELDSDIYNTVVALASDIISAQLEKSFSYDLSDDIDEGKDEALKKLYESLKDVNEITVTSQEVIIDISKDFINKKDYIIKPVVLITGFDVEVNTLVFDKVATMTE